MKIFNPGTKNNKISLALLVLRVPIGLMMMIQHGYPKLINYSDKASSFSDPIGVGSEISLILAIFAEFFCSIFLVLGVATRLVTIPLIITMLTAVFIIHADDPFSKQEFGLLYLVPFITLFITGAGKYSLDNIIGK